MYISIGKPGKVQKKTTRYDTFFVFTPACEGGAAVSAAFSKQECCRRHTCTHSRSALNFRLYPLNGTWTPALPAHLLLILPTKCGVCNIAFAVFFRLDNHAISLHLLIYRREHEDVEWDPIMKKSITLHAVWLNLPSGPLPCPLCMRTQTMFIDAINGRLYHHLISWNAIHFLPYYVANIFVEWFFPACPCCLRWNYLVSSALFRLSPQLLISRNLNRNICKLICAATARIVLCSMTCDFYIHKYEWGFILSHLFNRFHGKMRIVSPKIDK